MHIKKDSTYIFCPNRPTEKKQLDDLARKYL